MIARLEKNHVPGYHKQIKFFVDVIKFGIFQNFRDNVVVEML